MTSCKKGMITIDGGAVYINQWNINFVNIINDKSIECLYISVQTGTTIRSISTNLEAMSLYTNIFVEEDDTGDVHDNEHI
jgi:hypothetical protein